MKILAIETSCDETAIAVLECEGDENLARFTVLGNALISQIEIHKEYGGVFPALAKREHAKNLVPILEVALEEAELLHEDVQVITDATRTKISEILVREPGLTEVFFEFIGECEPPEIDAIAITAGPGLEPALWVGINFAKALSLVWNKPIVAVNHMEGHILSGLVKTETDEKFSISDLQFPILALLVSGGHTELVLMKEWLTYELIGQTRDDAVGEAYDKVARMLSLPYPGGPEISRLSEGARSDIDKQGPTLPPFKLPRPMMHDATYDFSFAGLKTAVLYFLKNKTEISDNEKIHIAHEFENAVTDVLWKKTSRALDETSAQTLVIGGGVSANAHIRRVFTEKMRGNFSDVMLRVPSAALATDNAIMIALAGFYRAQRKDFATEIVANGNLRLA